MKNVVSHSFIKILMLVLAFGGLFFGLVFGFNKVTSAITAIACVYSFAVASLRGKAKC